MDYNTEKIREEIHQSILSQFLDERRRFAS